MHLKRYWQMVPSKAESSAWDSAIHQSSEEYSHRMVLYLSSYESDPASHTLLLSSSA